MKKIKENKKCNYLGCKNKGIILDDIEVAPGKIEKGYVCEEHLGQLIGNIMREYDPN